MSRHPDCLGLYPCRKVSSEGPLAIIERVPGRSNGRSVGSACGNMVFAVATADNKLNDLTDQARECFAKIDGTLAKLGTDRASILSVSIFMADLGNKPVLDLIWLEWVGTDPAGWPQRSCLGAVLGVGTLIEITAVAFR
jgi:enamine deaminase RidA (YjgF/YER057c/UK114 family)